MRCLAVLFTAAMAASAWAKPPVALDDRLMIELIAQEPAIVTPTGVWADVRDNVWAIESNTHFPPKDYKGHPTDRLFVFSGYEQADAPTQSDAAKPGVALVDPKTGLAPGVKRTLFADNLMQAASITMTPAGQIYVVCRNEIVYFEDKNHDLKPDELDVGDGKKADRKTLVRLDTKATYPHNGLNGASLSPDGEFLYFCLGLNTGFDYTMNGSDGSKVAGGGEGGSVWRCTPAGGKVERIAIGFWNCHDLTFDAFGRLFAVDNDPDDIGPCRLLDIIEGGDYGWKYKNGRKGVHPFTSWNGELPGTLPMVAPTGEAPSGILAYESDNWPADYRGQLLVTSWGDYSIQRFELKEKGASFTSTPVNIIKGGDDFRPVGITQASDGSVFITDWVDKSYTLHSKGKLWRIRTKPPTTQPTQREPSGSAAGSRTTGFQPVPAVPKRLRVDDVLTQPVASLQLLLSHPRREIRASAGARLCESGNHGADVLMAYRNSAADARIRLSSAWAFHRLPKVERDRALDTSGMTKVEGIPVWDQSMPEAARPQAAMPELLRLIVLELGPTSTTVYPKENAALLFEGHRTMLNRTGLTTFPPGMDISSLVSSASGRKLDPFILSALIDAVARSDSFRSTPLSDESFANWGIIQSLAARSSSVRDMQKCLPVLLKNPDAAVRRVALQWIGEDRLVQFKDNLPDALKAGDVTRDLLATYLAAQEKLNTPLPEPGKPPAERSVSQFAVEFLLDEKNDPKLRKVALELIDPTDAKLPAKQLVAMIEPMGLEAIKAVAWRDDAESQAALRVVAGDAKRDLAERREAVLGLARSALTSPETQAVLRGVLFAKLNDPKANDAGSAADGEQGRPRSQDLRLDALRALRGALGAADGKALVAELSAEARSDKADRAGGPPPLDEPEWAEQIVLAFKASPDALSADDRKVIEPLLPKRPVDTAGWQAMIAPAPDDRTGKPVGDADAGRRVFALATGARCYVCHQFEGRGGIVGPDLSRVSFAMDHAKLVESIVEPSKEIAPLYVSAILELKNGDTLSGVSLNEAGANWISLADATGKRHRIKSDDVVSRREEKISVMPEGLLDSMSVREFQDLMAYLRRPQ